MGYGKQLYRATETRIRRLGRALGSLGVREEHFVPGVFTKRLIMY